MHGTYNTEHQKVLEVLGPREDLREQLAQQDDPAGMGSILFEGFVREAHGAGIAEDDIVLACLDPLPPFGGVIYKHVVANGSEEYVRRTIAEIKKKNNDAEIERLARLSTIECEQQLEAVAEKLGVGKTVLRKAVAEARKKLNSPDRNNNDGNKLEKLLRLNNEWCVIRFGSKVRVLRYETTDLHRTVATFYAQDDFKLFHNNIRIPNGDSDIGLGTRWVTWPQRRTYEGLKFEPKQGREIQIDGKRYLNLWQGFGIEPKKGPWRRLRKHIHRVLANGDCKMFKYIIKWTAWCLQNPDKQAEVALVFRGLKGTGKGLFGRLLREIFGQHGFQISHHEHMTGKFNKHFLDLVFLFADEAFWPGDKAGEGTLKRIITEDTLAVEPKFIDLELRRNRLHIIIVSNNEWVVPASHDERRFAVSNVSDKYARTNATEEDRKKSEENRKKYFEPLYKEIENGGAAAMLHDLLHMDLKGWHPRDDVPQTEALLDQKLLSLSYADQWLYELLKTAALQKPDANNPRRAQSDGLYKAARKIVPGLHFASNHLLGRILEDNGCKQCKVRSLRGWEFPELLEARANWDKKLPGTQWDEATEWIKDEANYDNDPL